MPRPPDPRRETLRRFAQRHHFGKPGYQGSPFKGTGGTTSENAINTPEGYETRDTLPAGQKITSAAGRRAKRAEAGVTDVRNASQAQIRRLRRLGLI